MSDVDLELLQAWTPEPLAPSAEVREHALAQLEHSYAGPPVRTTSGPASRRFGKRFAVAALAATVLIAGAVVWIQREADDRIDRIKTVTVPGDVLSQGEIAKGPVNVLLVGSDSRAGLDSPAFGTEADTGPPKSDTMILLHLDGSSVRALWIPRDLLVGTTGTKINSTFAQGPEGLIDTITGNLGVRIDHYAEVNFSAFQQIVDELGGVPVYSPGQVRDQFSGLELSGPGCRTLDGATALAWVRARHLQTFQNGMWVDASPRADLDRIVRQQELMHSLARRMKAEVSGDPEQAVHLVDTLIPALTVDSGFTRSEIYAFVRALIGLDPGTAQLSTLPVQAAPDGASVVMRQPDADAALAPFLNRPVPSGSLPDGFVGEGVESSATLTSEC